MTQPELTVEEMKDHALQRVIGMLKSNLFGTFLIGTAIDDQDENTLHSWSSYQLGTDRDCLQTMVILPSHLASWIEALLSGQTSTGCVSVDSNAGPPQNLDRLASVTASVATEVSEFFDRWLLIGSFSQKRGGLSPMIMSKRPDEEDLQVYVMSILQAAGVMTEEYMRKHGFTLGPSIRQLFRVRPSTRNRLDEF